MDTKSGHDMEVSKLSAQRKQLVTLPSRISYLEMKVEKLREQKEFLIRMRDFTKSQMTENEKKTCKCWLLWRSKEVDSVMRMFINEFLT